METKFRIIEKSEGVFYVEKKVWWYPLWVNLYYLFDPVPHFSVKSARDSIDRFRERARFKPRVVE
jgi:hypothetical protein